MLVDRQIQVLALFGFVLVGSIHAQTAQGHPAINFDRQVAKSSFASAKQCLELATAAERLRNEDRICDATRSKPNGDASCSAKSEALVSKAAKLTNRADDASCSRDPVILQRNYYEATKRSAMLGDVDAQMCFVEGQFRLQDMAAVEYYRSNAKNFATAAYERGDWRIALLMATPPLSVAHGGVGVLSDLPLVGRPFTAYRNVRLLQYGATGNYAKQLGEEAKGYSKSLAKDQMANANEWARETYSKHFKASPKLNSAPVACIDIKQHLDAL